MLLSSYVGTLIVGTVGPGLQSITMLSVSNPESFVSCPVRVAIIAEAMRFAIHPVTLIDIAAAIMLIV